MQSCASILSEKNQNVVIEAKERVKLYIDSNYIGEGHNFNVSLTKDNNVKTIKMIAEGYKTKNFTVIQNRRSDWYYLSLFPFGVLLYPAVFDIYSKARKYEDKYNIDGFHKYLYRNDKLKNLYLNEVNIQIQVGNVLVRVYEMGDYLKGDTNFYYENYFVKSKGFEEYFTKELNSTLVRTNFLDTLNTVFVENRNLLFLSLNLDKIEFSNIYQNSTPYFWTYNPQSSAYGKDVAYLHFGVEPFTPLSIGQSSVSGSIVVTDVFGDTVAVKSFIGESDLLPMKLKSFDKEGKNVILDALDYGLLNSIDSLFKDKSLDLDTSKIEFKDKISIERPAKIPKSIAEAMKATVTIKHKDGVGSGFFISNDGYIISSYNVISKNREYKVITEDGKEFIAKIIRSNKAIDLALLKIDYTPEFTYEVPDKSNADISDEVIAIGTPNSDQLGQTASKGIISGIRKHKNKNYIQTDIKLNKGNAGGPVILPGGQLNSVVEYKLQGRGVEGLSFSIPADEIFPSLNLGYK